MAKVVTLATSRVSSWKPTNKVIAAVVTGLATNVAPALLSGGWDATENGELLTLFVGVVGAYLKVNPDTPQGLQPERLT